MKVNNVLVSAVLLFGTLLTAQAQRRNEIQVPNLEGYVTLKCDFHMHTIFRTVWYGLRYVWTKLIGKDWMPFR